MPPHYGAFGVDLDLFLKALGAPGHDFGGLGSDLGGVFGGLGRPCGHGLDPELAQGGQNELNCTPVRAGASISEAPGFWGPPKWVVILPFLGLTM